MSTWLQAVTAQELDGLRARPEGINQLDKPHYYRTHFAPSINYFVMGSAYPGPDTGPLWSMLFGADFVDTRTLENGGFGTLSPAEASEVAGLLAGVDVAAVTARVTETDFGSLADEELEDLELLSEDEAPEVIGNELAELVDFYAETARTGLGVVMYTT